MEYDGASLGPSEDREALSYVRSGDWWPPDRQRVGTANALHTFWSKFLTLGAEVEHIREITQRGRAC